MIINLTALFKKIKAKMEDLLDMLDNCINLEIWWNEYYLQEGKFLVKDFNR